MHSLDSTRSIHFVGIKGIAMTALALWANDRGIAVTGSDVKTEFPSDSMLKNAGIAVSSGFSSTHINDSAKPDLVIYTGAHEGVDNIEVKTAIARGIPILSHGMALGLAMVGKSQITVAGSHGKTTTSAMIATILTHAGYDPSYAIGCGEIFGLGKPGHCGKGEFFVAEGDEYVTDKSHDDTPRFLWQTPEVLVVTNIGFDHPDVYASLSDVQHAFVRLQKKLTGMKTTVVNADDPSSTVLYPSGKTVSFGTTSSADYQVVDISNREMTTGTTKERRSAFTLKHKGKTVEAFILNVAGKHNALNAAAAGIACHAIGLSWKQITNGLCSFYGTKRRFEKIGEAQGILYYDDYAHHPDEIRATTVSARSWFLGRRLICVFQPHTYSRTKALLADFAKSFSNCDVVVLTDIYASAREHDTMGITGKTLVSEVSKHHKDVRYAPDANAVYKALKNMIHDNDVVFFMGAGDIYNWEKIIVQKLIHQQ